MTHFTFALIFSIHTEDSFAQVFNLFKEKQKNVIMP